MTAIRIGWPVTASGRNPARRSQSHPPRFTSLSVSPRAIFQSSHPFDAAAHTTADAPLGEGVMLEGLGDFRGS